MLFAFSCDSDLDQLEKSFEVEGRIPDSYYTNFNITYSDSGMLKVKITGKELEQFLKTDSAKGVDIMKDSVHVLFFNSDLVVSSELKADYAIRDHDSQEMRAKGNVEVINKLGEKLNTERLTWYSQTKKIICDTTVVITKPNGLKIVGSSLESDERFENYKIKKVRDSKIEFNREEAPE